MKQNIIFIPLFIEGSNLMLHIYVWPVLHISLGSFNAPHRTVSMVEQCHCCVSIDHLPELAFYDVGEVCRISEKN